MKHFPPGLFLREAPLRRKSWSDRRKALFHCPHAGGCGKVINSFSIWRRATWFRSLPGGGLAARWPTGPRDRIHLPPAGAEYPHLRRTVRLLRLRRPARILSDCAAALVQQSRIWGTFPDPRRQKRHPWLWCTLAWNEGNPGLPGPCPRFPSRGLPHAFCPSDLMSAVRVRQAWAAGPSMLSSGRPLPSLRRDT